MKKQTNEQKMARCLIEIVEFLEGEDPGTQPGSTLYNNVKMRMEPILRGKQLPLFKEMEDGTPKE